MEATIIISRYEEHSDRGAIVNRSLKETVEVDLNTIEVGKPLPGLPDSIVRQYDITLLELEYSGKTFRLTPGKEQTVGYSGLGGQMGVCQDMVTNVKYAIDKPLFIQSGDKSIESRVKSWELNDPIGEGEVWLPNGDYFKGCFHLFTASSKNPAYTAEGRYTFANGDYIEHAWIETDSKFDSFLLTGLYRICTSTGFNYCIAMFSGGIRCGVVLDMPDRYCNLYIAQHWHDGKVQLDFPNEVIEHDIDESEGDDCMRLTIVLHDSYGDYIVSQHGGSRLKDDNGNLIYIPSVSSCMKYPNGDVKNLLLRNDKD